MLLRQHIHEVPHPRKEESRTNPESAEGLLLKVGPVKFASSIAYQKYKVYRTRTFPFSFSGMGILRLTSHPPNVTLQHTYRHPS
jgi:hypothetical protein